MRFLPGLDQRRDTILSVIVIPMEPNLLQVSHKSIHNATFPGDAPRIGVSVVQDFRLIAHFGRIACQSIQSTLLKQTLAGLGDIEKTKRL